VGGKTGHKNSVGGKLVCAGEKDFSTTKIDLTI
jgi:hypothetical protein